MRFHCNKEDNEKEDKEEEEDNLYHFLRWLCYTKWLHVPFICGSATKKVTIAMSSPSFMVVVWWRRRWLKVDFSRLFIYLFCDSFGLMR
jgi:hypothetical protein